MIKILYAATNNYHSKIQLERFLENIDRNKYNIKIAAYQKYLPNCEINWTLDPCLMPDKDNKYLFSNNKYLDIYEQQIINFNPDLIVSDLEIYSSFLALKLNKKLWHVSSKLHNFALSQIFKEELGIHKYYKALYENSHLHKAISDLIAGANKNFVYSHFCDVDEKIFLKEGFEWIRPYHYIGKISPAAQHKYVALDCDNFELIKYLSDLKSDVVLFSDKNIPYQNIICKKYSDKEEYQYNITNSEIIVCHGEASVLADAFYNKKKIKILPDQNSREGMFNYLIYHKIYNYMIDDNLISAIDPSIDASTKFLHQEIENNL